MKKKHVFILLGMCQLLLWACSKSNDADNQSTNPGPNGEGGPTTSVEINPPNTNYRPSFSGQTRIAAVRTTTPIQTEILTSSLNNPWGITTLPDGRFLITEKAGTMRIVSTTGQVGSPLSGIPTVNSSGQGGLLGLCIDPQYATNRMVYWVFSQPVNRGYQTVAASGRLSDDERSIENASVIFQANPAYSGNIQYGGRMLFDPSGNLIASTGDRGDASIRGQAQSLSSGLGKIVRMTRDGQPAPGNPFAGQSDALPQLYSLGHRNPQGLAIHPVTGDLWECEHGPRGGDELNRIQAGSNYGWPTITYGIEYSGQPIGAGLQQQNGMEQPVYYWDPVVSPSGMTFYNSNRISEWRNNLFACSLSAQHIIRLVIEDNRVTGEERLLAGEAQRFRDITQGTDGAMYAITDGGRLYKIDRQ